MQQVQHHVSQRKSSTNLNLQSQSQSHGQKLVCDVPTPCPTQAPVYQRAPVPLPSPQLCSDLWVYGYLTRAGNRSLTCSSAPPWPPHLRTAHLLRPSQQMCAHGSKPYHPETRPTPLPMMWQRSLRGEYAERFFAPRHRPQPRTLAHSCSSSGTSASWHGRADLQPAWCPPNRTVTCFECHHPSTTLFQQSAEVQDRSLVLDLDRGTCQGLGGGLQVANYSCSSSRSSRRKVRQQKERSDGLPAVAWLTCCW